jgi:hypothetical protein
MYAIAAGQVPSPEIGDVHGAGIVRALLLKRQMMRSDFFCVPGTAPPFRRTGFRPQVSPATRERMVRAVRLRGRPPGQVSSR